MKTRSLTTLYTLAYNEVKDKPDRSQDLNGMCHLFFRMYTQGKITWEEEQKMTNFLALNKPCQHSNCEFALDPLYDDETVYWFPVGNWEIRKRFLLKLIEKSKPWYVKLYESWKQKPKAQK